MNLIIDGNNISNVAYHRAKSLMYKEYKTKINADPSSQEKNYKYLVETLPNFSTKIFFNILHKYFKDFKATDIYVVWDGRMGSSWRKEENSDYKSNRDHSLDNLYATFIQSLEQERSILDEYPVYQLGLLEAEADDLIYNLCGTLEGDKVVISSDGDLVQLPQKFKDLKVWNPRTKKYVDVPEYDIVMFKAIVGDTSDTITGLEKFGPKTALKVLSGEKILNWDQLNIVEENRKIIDLALNPHVKKNQEYVNKVLCSSKIKLDPEKVKKLYFKFKLSEFLKKWDPIYELLLKLERETTNGGKEAS